MRDWISQYLDTDPVWWHFWDPRNGIGGGLVTGVALAIVYLALLKLGAI